MSSGEKVADAFVLGDLGGRPEGVKSAKTRKRAEESDRNLLDDEAKSLLEKGLKLKENEESRLDRVGRIAEVKDLVSLYGKDDPLVLKMLAKLRESLLAEMN